MQRKRAVIVRITVSAKKGVSSTIKRKFFRLMGMIVQLVLATAVAPLLPRVIALQVRYEPMPALPERGVRY